MRSILEGEYHDVYPQSESCKSWEILNLLKIFIRESFLCLRAPFPDTFPLNTRLMKPYPYWNLEKEKRIFNYRLSRVRRVVENAFGILAHRWRVFLTTIKLSPDKVTDIIFAACCLHNLMVEKNKASYTSAADLENTDHTLGRGTWRNDQVLTNIQPTTLHNATKDAKTQRVLLTDYFNNYGSVPWQSSMVA